jgi:hypothetical protein
LTELVRSLTVGALENVPIARNCPLWVKAPKVIPLGMMVSERMFPPLPPEVPPVEAVTVTTVLELTCPLYDVVLAVTVVLPAPTAVTDPEELTVATAETVDVQVTLLVMSCVEECYCRRSQLPSVVQSDQQ